MVLDHPVYRLDARRWPSELRVRLGSGDGGSDWLPLRDVPDGISSGILVDFDAKHRVCGFEVVELDLVAPWGAADHELGEASASPCNGVLLSPPEGSTEQRKLIDWAGGIISYAGADDPHISLHWHARRSYDYSAELIELAEDAVDWISVGVDGVGRFVGLSIENPRRHVRGLG